MKPLKESNFEKKTTKSTLLLYVLDPIQSKIKHGSSSPNPLQLNTCLIVDSSSVLKEMYLGYTNL